MFLTEILTLYTRHVCELNLINLNNGTVNSYRKNSAPKVSDAKMSISCHGLFTDVTKYFSDNFLS